MASRTIPVEKRLRMSLLLDIYGELLAEKQRTFMRLYYDGDFSMGEIAAENGVSRQAIFDAVKHGESALENFERVLKLLPTRLKKGKARPSGDAPDEFYARLAHVAQTLRGLAENSDGDGSTPTAQKLLAGIEEAARRIEDLDIEMSQRSAGAPGFTADEAGGGFIGGIFRREGPEVD